MHPSDITAAIATALHTAGLGVYDPGTVPDGDTPLIAVGREPSTPDRCFTVHPYVVSDSLEGARVQGVQVITRGGRFDPFGPEDMAQDVYDELHGAALPGIPLLWRQSCAPLGYDDNDRRRVTSNYHMHTSAPTVHTR